MGIAHANLAKGRLDEVRKTPGSQDLSCAGELAKLSSLGDILSDVAGNNDGAVKWSSVVAGAKAQLEAAISEVKALDMWTKQGVGQLSIKLDAGHDRKRYAIALLKASFSALSSAEL